MDVQLPRMTDAHVHFRQGKMAEEVVRYSARCCDNVIAMPNTAPPIHGPDSILEYKKLYQGLAGKHCTVHMTAKLLPTTTPDDVYRAADAGVVGFKLYPAGVTTNSHDGIDSRWLYTMPDAFCNVLAAMQKRDLVLLNHGESLIKRATGKSAFCMDREHEFLPFLDTALTHFPKLRMTLEHITTVAGVNAIIKHYGNGSRVLGTITLHHMMTSLDDVLGDKLRPDLFCKPIPKSPDDTFCLLNTALDGRRRCFAFGSDSAPHPVADKRSAECCAGVFTAPVMAEAAAGLFEIELKSRRNQYENFFVNNANDFYGFESSGVTMTMRDGGWNVPWETSGVIPFLAGTATKWRQLF